MEDDQKGQQREGRFGRRASDLKPRFPEMPDDKPDMK
jgi:hypothetical protein